MQEGWWVKWSGKAEGWISKERREIKQSLNGLTKGQKNAGQHQGPTSRQWS